MHAFEAALRRKDADARFFFAPKSLRAGGFWLPELAQEIAEATAFILLVGEKGIGPWQAMEYYEALDRRVKFSLLLQGKAQISMSQVVLRRKLRCTLVTKNRLFPAAKPFQ